MNIGAMTPATVTLNHGIPEYLASGRRWQGIPAITRSRGGKLYAAWYSGGTGEQPGNVIIAEKSEDGGETWTDGWLLVKHDDPEVRCFDEALWTDPSGRLWLFWTQSRGFYDGRDGVWCAVCGDPDADDSVFAEPRRIANGLMLNKPTVLKDGTWLMPAALWSSDFSKAGEDHPELADEVLANVYASTDNGVTFVRRGGVEMPERAFDEHMVVERGDGSLWMLTRTTYGIGQAFSRNGGFIWTDAGPSGHTGPDSRFFIRRLASGRLLMVNHVNPTYLTNPQSWNVRNNLMAMLSEDDGRTWIGGLMLDTRDSVSYPDGVEDENGLIRVIYDRERSDAREILVAAFTEEDILAGSLVTPGSRLRQVINAATGEHV